MAQEGEERKGSFRLGSEPALGRLGEGVTHGLRCSSTKVPGAFPRTAEQTQRCWRCAGYASWCPHPASPKDSETPESPLHDLLVDVIRVSVGRGTSHFMMYTTWGGGVAARDPGAGKALRTTQHNSLGLEIGRKVPRKPIT